MRDEDLRNRYRRNFSTEPIKTGPMRPTAPQPVPAPADHSTPTAPPTTVHQPVRPKRGKRRFLIIFIILILVAAGVGGYLYEKTKNVVPASVVAQADIPVLYPSKLPPGYKIDKSSFKVSNGNIISYYASNQTSSRLVFTVQARPASFDYDKFYSESMTNTTKITTSIGEGAVGTAGGHLLGSLATTKSWILITSNNNNIGANKIQTALSSLKSTD